MSNGDRALPGKTLITLLNKAGQASGNLNTLIMLQVKNEETAAILSDQLPKVRVYTKVAESRTTDNNDPDTPVDFIAHA
ncbi:MAG: hypothetical protein ABW087_07045 [Candidatus Thiodiazotropha sp.]